MLKAMLRSLRRNWYVAIIGVLLTAGLAAGATVAVPATYTAQAQMVLLPPPRATSANDVNVNANALANPYTQLAGLQSMADVVARSMMDESTAQKLRAAGVGTYIVQFDTISAAPIILVQTEGATPKQTLQAMDLLLQQITQTATRLQSQNSIPAESFVRLSVIVRPGSPQRSGKTQLRAAAVAVVAGLVLTLLVVALTDSWRMRRKTRRRARDAQPASLEPPTPAEQPEADDADASTTETDTDKTDTSTTETDTDKTDTSTTETDAVEDEKSPGEPLVDTTAGSAKS